MLRLYRIYHYVTFYFRIRIIDQFLGVLIFQFFRVIEFYFCQIHSQILRLGEV